MKNKKNTLKTEQIHLAASIQYRVNRYRVQPLTAGRVRFPVSVKLVAAAVRPMLASFTPSVLAVPENYRGEYGKAAPYAVPYAVHVPTAPTWAEIAAAVKARKAAAVLLPLDVHVMSLKAVRAVIRNRLKHGGMIANDSRPETYTAFGAAGRKPASNDYTKRLFEYRADISDWYGLDTDKMHKAGHWERLENLDALAADYDAQAAAAHLASVNASKRAVSARHSGDIAAQYAAQRERDTLRTEERRAHRNGTAARKAREKELATIAGDGAELYSVAYAYFWEKLAVNGLTAQSILFGKGKDKRDYTKTVYQWGFTMVNRSTLGNLAADKNTAAWAEYIERTAKAEERENVEDMEKNTLERAPRYWDTTPTADTTPTVENIDKMQELIQRLNLSKTQNVILEMKLRGMSHQQIANALHVGKSTVETHVNRMKKYIIQRLNLSDEKVAELTAKAAK